MYVWHRVRELRVLFFFSSRRRHTRSYGDWSSDVCSSDLRPDQVRSRAQVQDKLATVHAWRQDVDEHQIGFFSPDDPQRSLAVGSLQQAVAAVLEQGHHEAPIDGALLDDKDRGHNPPRIPQRWNPRGWLCLRHTINIRKEITHGVAEKRAVSGRIPAGTKEDRTEKTGSRNSPHRTIVSALNH